MGTRATYLQERIARLIPPPDPVGWHKVRIKLEAAAIAADDFGPTPTLEEQVHEAETQLYLNRHLVRTDATPQSWNVDDAALWRFGVSTAVGEGASGYFLDVWGRTHGVGRLEGETDASYTRRILLSVGRPVTTNNGMASCIEESLGISPVDVYEAGLALVFYRLNDGSLLDDPDVCLNSSGDIDSSDACFVVCVPESAKYLSANISAIVNSLKAEGTRFVGLILRQDLDGFGYAQFGNSPFAGWQDIPVFGLSTFDYSAFGG